MQKAFHTTRTRCKTILTVSGFALALTFAAAQAQSAAPAAKGKNATAKPLARTPWGTPTLTDWNGVWSIYRGPAVKNARWMPVPEPTPEYAPYAEASKKAKAEHKELSTVARCLPLGMPGVDNFTYPADIRVQPTQISIMYEYGGAFRRIRINSVHPDYVEPTFIGDAIAHWEGDTLVIDTVAITTKTILYSSFNDTYAARHSNQMHVIQRWREVQPGLIEIHTWMEDPRAFAKPVEWVSAIQKTPDEEVNEHICEHSFEQSFSFDAFEVIPEPEQTEVHWADINSNNTLIKRNGK